MSAHFDVVVIGSGAGGATLAQRLAPTGKSILILERGEHLPREPENWSPKAVFIQHRYRTQERWFDKHGHPFTPNTHYWVGGNTSFYGAALLRLRGRDFEEVQHAGGASPAWPISLTDLAAYYMEAETLWQVHGSRGDDPTEEGNEPPYAYAAVHDDPGIAQLRTHWQEQGWRPFSLPLGINLDQAHPVTSACIKCKTCGGYPCLLKAKSDARTIAIEPLMGMANVTLLTGRKVTRLETDPQGNERAATWQRQSEALHAALAPIAREPLPLSMMLKLRNDKPAAWHRDTTLWLYVGTFAAGVAVGLALVYAMPTLRALIGI